MYLAMRLDDLKILESFLQNSLHAHLARIIPFRVQCAYKHDTLWVLAQHPADVEIDKDDTFKVLEQALQAETPKTPLTVKLYLKTEGDRRPYSHQSFSVYPTVKPAIPGEAAPEMTVNNEERVSVNRAVNGKTPMKSIPLTETLLTTTSDRLQPVIMGEIVTPERREIPAENALVKIDEDGFSSNLESAIVESPAAINSPPQTPRATAKRNILLPILGGLGAIAFGSGAGYMGTRPCVFGACTILDSATQVAQSSFDTVNNPKSTGKDILFAQQQLHQSVVTLESIPMWSGSYNTAQQSLQATTPQISHLDITVEAMNKGFRATNLVKIPPIPLLKWQESKRLWVESIANLSKIPTTSKVYPLAQQKLTEYQGKLGNIEQRIGAETTANEALKTSITETTLAIQATTVAKTLPEWQAVKAMWDKINDKLTNIPATTIAYTQAQELLKTDLPQIAAASEKVAEETKATQNYNIAIKSATDAKLAQKNNQLSVAVQQWNQAVIAIQSIPPTSAVFTQAKSLVFEYTKSFQRAEEQLKTGEKTVRATQDLQRTCAGTPQICTYIVTNKEIIVRFTPLYSNTVMQTAKSALDRNNVTAKAGILTHVNTLGDALQTISENAQLPISVYTADGKQIQNYRPQR
jgi:hypothetical protein